MDLQKKFRFRPVSEQLEDRMTPAHLGSVVVEPPSGVYVTVPHAEVQLPDTAQASGPIDAPSHGQPHKTRILSPGFLHVELE
jgi:hypothetical protein